MSVVRVAGMMSAFTFGFLYCVVCMTGCGNSGQVTEAQNDPSIEATAASAADEIETEISGSNSDQKSTERETYQSGMEIGAIPLPFEVADVTGPHKGKTLCYRCLYGERPVVGVFVRELDESTTKLIQEIDAAVDALQDEKLAAFVVMLTETPAEVKPDLERIAAEYQIQHVPLTVYEGVTGPPGYNVKQDASVNVMMWEGVVKANRAYQAGQLKPEEIKEVIADTKLIVH